MKRDAATRIARHIAAPGELSALIMTSGMQLEVALTLLFSAKEALFKALNPMVGRHFGFADAWVDRVDPSRRHFRARLMTDLSTEWRSGATFEGSYALDGSEPRPSVHTALIVY